MFTSKQWMTIAAAGALCTLLFALAGTQNIGGLLLAQFYQLPLFVIGMSMGTVAGAIAGAVAGVGVVIMGGLFGLFAFAVMNAGPVVYLVRQALLSRADEQGQTEWYPAGLLATSATVYGLALLTLACIWFEISADGIEDSGRIFLTDLSNSMLAPLPEAERMKFVDFFAPILPGAVGLYWLMMLVVNGTLGQGLATRFQWNLRPSPDFSTMALPRWLPMVTAAILLGTVFLPGTLGFLATNAAMIAMFPFFLVGLAVVHVAARRVTPGPMLLIMFYFLMVLFGWPVVLVAFLGLIEQMAGFRQRLARVGEED